MRSLLRAFMAKSRFMLFDETFAFEQFIGLALHRKRTFGDVLPERSLGS